MTNANPPAKPNPSAPKPEALDDATLDAVAGGKRSNVRDSHDKYANQEVKY